MRTPLLLSLVVGALGAPLAAQVRDAGARVERVADGIYVIIHENATDEWPHGNTGVVVGQNAVAVINATYLPSRPRRHRADPPHDAETGPLPDLHPLALRP